MKTLFCPNNRCVKTDEGKKLVHLTKTELESAFSFFQLNNSVIENANFFKINCKNNHDFDFTVRILNSLGASCYINNTLQKTDELEFQNYQIDRVNDNSEQKTYLQHKHICPYVYVQREDYVYVYYPAVYFALPFLEGKYSSWRTLILENWFYWTSFLYFSKFQCLHTDVVDVKFDNKFFHAYCKLSLDVQSWSDFVDKFSKIPSYLHRNFLAYFIRLLALDYIIGLKRDPSELVVRGRISALPSKSILQYSQSINKYDFAQFLYSQINSFFSSSLKFEESAIEQAIQAVGAWMQDNLPVVAKFLIDKINNKFKSLKNKKSDRFDGELFDFSLTPTIRSAVKAVGDYFADKTVIDELKARVLSFKDNSNTYPVLEIANYNPSVVLHNFQKHNILKSSTVNVPITELGEFAKITSQPIPYIESLLQLSRHNSRGIELFSFFMDEVTRV